MSPETAAMLHAIPRIRDRHRRQAIYLNCLQALTAGEAAFFYRIYNHVAMTRSVTPRIYDWLAEESRRHSATRSPAVELARHFLELFDIWCKSPIDEEVDLLTRIFEILEDLNIAAIAHRQKICLGHARHRNAHFKAQQRQFYMASSN